MTTFVICSGSTGAEGAVAREGVTKGGEEKVRGLTPKSGALSKALGVWGLPFVPDGGGGSRGIEGLVAGAQCEFFIAVVSSVLTEESGRRFVELSFGESTLFRSHNTREPYW